MSNTCLCPRYWDKFLTNYYFTCILCGYESWPTHKYRRRFEVSDNVEEILQLTAQHIVIETLIFSQLIKKFCATYGSLTLSIMSGRACWQS